MLQKFHTNSFFFQEDMLNYIKPCRCAKMYGFSKQGHKFDLYIELRNFCMNASIYWKFSMSKTTLSQGLHIDNKRNLFDVSSEKL